MFSPGMLGFRCNICGSKNEVLAHELGRETPSCRTCGSTVRMRGMIHALAIALYGKAMTISEFPDDKRVVGVGMSDWDGYAVPLAKKFSYVNSYYHKPPSLDITNIKPENIESIDFLLSTDVFEHVAPPVSKAFENARAMLKKGGAFVFSVPYSLEEHTVEHFPNLHDYSLESRPAGRVLVNRTRQGEVEEFGDLVFHGGEGETLEMRVFSKNDLLQDLRNAGFKDVQIMDEPYFPHGIYWPHCWSLPMIARV